MSFAVRVARLKRKLSKSSQVEESPGLPVLSVFEAADFAHGGLAGFARAADVRGQVAGAWKLEPGEARTQFIERARNGALELGARRLLIGGVPVLADRGLQDPGPAPQPLPRHVISMPDGALHTGQINALRVVQSRRFTALRCGRRFGKTSLAAALAADTALLGGMAGLFAPIFKLSSPLFDILAMALAPVIAASNRSFGELRLTGGGGCDVWSLEHPRAGRGRRYNLAVIDEGAHGDPELTGIWSASIRPTLADLAGPAIVASTPNGVSETNFFWKICNEEIFGFTEFVAPTSRNPFIPTSELEELRRVHNPAVYAQEFEAQFVNLAGVGLFDVAAMLNGGEPWETPEKFDIVFAALDSGVRGGREHDASAVVYFGLNVHLAPRGLYVLDWEAVELGAGDLELWFVGISRRLADYAERTRFGSRGISIERAGLGEMLLAKADVLKVQAQEINSVLVSRGKDLRALSADPLINGGQVRLTRAACDRTSRLKGVLRNHLLTQTAAFRVADREAWKRADDLVDCLVYGALIAFNPE
jgi:hypothetical protein